MRKRAAEDGEKQQRKKDKEATESKTLLGEETLRTPQSQCDETLMVYCPRDEQRWDPCATGRSSLQPEEKPMSSMTVTSPTIAVADRLYVQYQFSSQHLDQRETLSEDTRNTIQKLEDCKGEGK